MTKHHDPIVDLPFDIVTEIFTFLNQRDCLSCMKVCKTWYTAVPEYTKEIWRTLRLTEKDPRKDMDGCFGACLGGHVKNIEFNNFKEDKDLYNIMEKLVGWKCDQVESLVFIKCATVDQDSFIRMLRLLGWNKLTYLTMLNHGSNVSFIHVLDACPQLSYLTYSPTTSAYRKYKVYDTEPLVTINSNSNNNKKSDKSFATRLLLYRPIEKKAPNNNSLVYLNVDAVIHKEKRLVPLLKRCRNIQYIIGANVESCGERSFPIQLDELLKLCPTLIYYASNGSYSYLDATSWTDPTIIVTEASKNDCTRMGTATPVDIENLYTTDIANKREQIKDKTTLFHLSLSMAQDHYDQIFRILNKYQEKLGYLKLVSNMFNDDAAEMLMLFQSLNMPNLRTLICDTIDFGSSDSVVSLLNTCAKTIQTVSLDLRHLDSTFVDIIMVQPSIQALHPLEQLHTLHFYGIPFDTAGAMVTLLERVRNLERLVMIGCFLTFNIQPPTRIFECLKNLEHLELSDITWHLLNNNDESPRYYTKEISLKPKDVVIVPPALFHYLSQDPKLETVILKSVFSMSNELLFAIAQIPILKVFQLKSGEHAPLPFLPHSPATTINNDNNSDNGHSTAFDFFRTLHDETTGLEQLTLHNFAHTIGDAAFDILASMPKLKKLDVSLSLWNPEDPNGILQLLRKNKNLALAAFRNTCSFEGSPGSILRKQMHKFNITDYNIQIPSSHQLRLLHSGTNRNDYLFRDDIIIMKENLCKLYHPL
ncbi:hypothetical protein BDA99DRAFT_608283 [Phascolomyces articulosus]|uniref:F-box domain-containing protein n=1 Tax=Phascolomyces articulosus TaxID=60185 RepID=A0AAD5P9U8_9FUNG|nr:hypothetical protein BDA99DRAFT_608283 [Phascolomyces articulosus]